MPTAAVSTTAAELLTGESQQQLHTQTNKLSTLQTNTAQLQLAIAIQFLNGEKQL